MRAPLTLLLLCLPLLALADTFIVTSNADSGPGTLRTALQQAAANGTAVTDSIAFHLPGTQLADRTIYLSQGLPAMTSHLVIDASTQSGDFIGNSRAKVVLLVPSVVSGPFDVFSAANASNLAIYGFSIKGQVLNTAGAVSNGTLFTNCTDIHIGDATRGNVFFGLSNCIAASGAGSSRLTIQGNIVGLEEDGAPNTTVYKTGNGIYCKDVADITIGGTAIAAGNVLSCDSSSINISSSGTNNGQLVIGHNIIGYDITGKIVVNDPSINYAAIRGLSTSAHQAAYTITVADNQINSIGFYYLAGSIVLVRNTIGCDITGHAPVRPTIQNYGVLISLCTATVIVGGATDADKNIFGYGNLDALAVHNSFYVTITRNSFYCNAGPGIHDLGRFIYPNYPAPPAATFITAKYLTGTTIGGTATPGAAVEIFETDECYCQGKTYITTVYANANGEWRYTGANSAHVTATATAHHSTSGFLKTQQDLQHAVITPSTCGKANGAITGVTIVSATSFYWKSVATGQPISTDTNLVHVPAGKYQLVMTIGAGHCSTDSTYVITDIPAPAFDINTIALTQPSCGAANGQLSFATPLGKDYQYTLLTPNGNTVAIDPDSYHPLTNLAPGSYMLLAQTLSDTTCRAEFGPIALLNSSSFAALTVTQQQKKDADRNEANGYIHPIAFDRHTGPYRFQWKALPANEVISGKLALDGIDKGIYALYATDPHGCDGMILTDTIHQLGLPVVPVPAPTVLTIPNIFTPNGDGVHDQWRIAYEGAVTDFTVAVYNRWGQAVFTDRSPGFQWDGKAGGALASPGAYYYIIRYKNSQGLAQQAAGMVSLVR